MSLIDPGELARIRDDFAGLLPATGTIQRSARVSDGGGGFTQTWSDLATVACRIGPIKGGEGASSGARGASTLGARIVDETTHVVTVPASQDITEADRIVIAGTTYDITLVKSRSYEVHRRVEVKEAP